MLHEETVTDLEVLDFLELFNSTVESAKHLGISQSSCSRRYRSFSELLGIGFDRISDQYRATTNFDVLTSLRQAAQKLRVRQLRPRISIGWLLGDLSLPGLDKVGKVLPIRPMSSWKLLSLLDQRLVDVSLMGLMEFQGLLRQPIARLRSRLLPLSSSMLCVPIGMLEFKLLAHRDHPLHGKSNLKADELRLFPSPALPLGMAPTLIEGLQCHGLASQQCGLIDYNESSWEGFASDGHGLSYGTLHHILNLEGRYNIRPLNYNLNMKDCIGIVGHRDVLTDTSFTKIYSQSIACLKAGTKSDGTAIKWLS